ncbi:MAG: hypothetical protein LBR39_01055 [Coriobacteriales bacterium]|jgi:hypothetical protein|nr:hypothetical protein [Coriobacteriales bacterium]
MSTDPEQFDLFDDLEPEEGFDPLQDTDSEEDEDEDVAVIGLVSTQAEADALRYRPEKVDDRPAAERIASLMEAMAPRRKVLLGILDFCLEPQTVPDVGAKVDELQENNYSVYTAANFCALLEKAGAIQRVTEEGEDFANIKVEPKVVEVDGVEYLEPGQPPEAFWLTTEAGREALEADKPLERLQQLLATDTLYLPIYKKILLLCAQEGGQSVKQLGDVIDGLELVQKPRMYAQRFLDRLEKCDAVIWRKKWQTTEVGQQGLEMLDDVEDIIIGELLEATQSASPDTGNEVA